jgi:ABC-type transporter Mla subunit MlaD
MTNLTSKDVTRAVQDGLRSIQAEIQRLNSVIANVDNQAKWIGEIQRTTQNISQKVDKIPHNSTDLDRILAELADMHRDIHGTVNRITNIERFCQDTSRYLQDLSRKKGDVDDGFRSSNADS